LDGVMLIPLSLLLLLFSPSGAKKRRCFLCSDSNVERHYGLFFSTPREVQGADVGSVRRCDTVDVPSIDCSSLCFSLNVSSSNGKRNGEDLPYGNSYGCSSQVMPLQLDLDKPGCQLVDIVLKTVPPYKVQAQYCTCAGDDCNPVTVVNHSRHKGGLGVSYTQDIDSSAHSVVNHVLYSASGRGTDLRSLVTMVFLILILR
ncbi:hypothetical protein PENTCL1PPCAC_7441, partial [Pristionchus entomophagus]